MSTLRSFLPLGVAALALAVLSGCASHGEIMARLDKQRESALSTLTWLPFVAWLLVLVAVGFWVAALATAMNATKSARLLNEQIAEASARRLQLADEREDAEGAAFDASRIRADAEGLHKSLQDEPQHEANA